MLSRLCRLVLAVRLVLLLVGLWTVGTGDPWLLLALAAFAVATLAALVGWPHAPRPFVTMPLALQVDLAGLVVILLAAGPVDGLVAAAYSAAALAGLVRRWCGAVLGGGVLAATILASAALHPDPAGGSEPTGTAGAWPLDGWQHVVLALVFAGVGAVVRQVVDQHVESSRRHLVARVTASATAEREELGRRLHDSLVPNLASLQLLAEQVRDAVRAGDPAGARLASLAATVAQEAAAGSRGLVRRQREGLQPAALPELVAKIAGDWGSGAAIDVVLSVDETVDVPLSVSSALELVLREALENVRRHSRARRVQVRLVLAGRDVVLEVADDGVGFPPDVRLADLVGRGSYGVLGMQERMSTVDGHLEVLPGPTGGTVVRAVAGPASRRGDGSAPTDARREGPGEPRGTAREQIGPGAGQIR